MPSDTTVSNYVDLVYNDTKKKIVESVTGVESALTTDMWTSLANKGFITITCHYIYQDWKLNNTLLATRITSDRHTGINIARELKKIADEFGLGGVIALVADNASNMVTAAEEGGYTCQPCVSHTLQLCINDRLKHQSRKQWLLRRDSLVTSHILRWPPKPYTTIRGKWGLTGPCASSRMWPRGGIRHFLWLNDC